MVRIVKVRFCHFILCSFVLNQVQSLSITYDGMVKDELNLEEKDAVFVINLPVLVLHYLKVGGPSPPSSLLPYFIHLLTYIVLSQVCTCTCYEQKSMYCPLSV